MPVIAISKPATLTPAAEETVSTSSATKTVPANQKAIDALPLDSGTWRISGIPGLYVRCRAKSKSFFLQRRVRGTLIKQSLGALTMKDAKEKALSSWSGMRRKPALGQTTFAQTFEAYMEQATLATATVTNYRINFTTYLQDWHQRPVRDIGTERED
ncbi:MAG TPA: hypothetical protein VMU80_13890, partial [Bryobacteraceae bacterium]|nr:hypothetical protein [Bryobacteraceae bacterium]